MARRRRFARSRARFAGYRSRAGSLGNKAGLNVSIPFLVGAAVGWSDLDAKIPNNLVLAGATVPVRGLGTIKAGSQGIIFGNLLKSLMSGNLSGGSANTGGGV